jgi:hypothetical protein
MRSLSLALLATVLLGVGEPASAQTREGFFIGVGTGIAWGTASADAMPSRDGRQGWLMPVRLGWKVSDQYSLGLESGMWGESDSDSAVDTVSYDLALYYYPAARGLFLKSGIGLTRAHIAGLDQEVVSGTGLGGLIGAGYDIPIGGGKVAVTPIATLRFGGPGTLSPDDGSGEAVHGFRHRSFELGIGFSFY